MECKKVLTLQRFYKCDNSPLYPDGRFHMCVTCVGNLSNGENGYEIVLMILHAMNKPFIQSLWDDCDVSGNYFRQINSLPQYRGLSWDNSDFGDSIILEKTKENDNYVDLDVMENRWGSGYTPEEYTLFERKYAVLKNNYPEKTSMHTEALFTYIRYRVKEELSTAKGDVKDAKEWGTLASKAATDAKINPSQLSQADLTDGLDTVGQIVRATEQVEDIISILPQFKSRPKDKVDFTIWSYINYARDLEGKSLIDYKDVYEFYEERKSEYEDEYGIIEEEGD